MELEYEDIPYKPTLDELIDMIKQAGPEDISDVGLKIDFALKRSTAKDYLFGMLEAHRLNLIEYNRICETCGKIMVTSEDLATRIQKYGYSFCSKKCLEYFEEMLNAMEDEYWAQEIARNIL